MTHLVKIHIDPLDLFISAIDAETVTYETWREDKIIKPRTTCKYQIVEAGIMFDGILLFDKTVKQVYDLLKTEEVGQVL